VCGECGRSARTYTRAEVLAYGERVRVAFAVQVGVPVNYDAAQLDLAALLGGEG
jgi:hypothetical protein